MHPRKTQGSDLIIYEDGTLYHLDLKRSERIPLNLLLVGSAQRVDQIAGHFDSVSFRHRNAARPELYMVAGMYRRMPVAALSCGMGPGNMEIVMNELHALFEYNHLSRRWDRRPRRVNIIRVGTSGTSQPEVRVGRMAISNLSIGLDNLGTFYRARKVSKPAAAALQQLRRTAFYKINPATYCAAPTPRVVGALQASAARHGEDAVSGITTTSPGFFVPQGRVIGRMKTRVYAAGFLRQVQQFRVGRKRIVNHEMETSVLFRLGHEILGYNVGAICLVLDNLATQEVLEQGRARARMEGCISVALDALLLLNRWEMGAGATGSPSRECAD